MTRRGLAAVAGAAGPRAEVVVAGSRAEAAAAVDGGDAIEFDDSYFTDAEREERCQLDEALSRICHHAARLVCCEVERAAQMTSESVFFDDREVQRCVGLAVLNGAAGEAARLAGAAHRERLRAMRVRSQAFATAAMRSAMRMSAAARRAGRSHLPPDDL
jgi:hypothetical protein